ncbi:hypothetical protein I4F81_006062 [Pyropia yezoensis]|uniref:Uncharacterized protein n=1 Tax=Pyropia yezoensis TaxID=2788 RepID=A0ACC3C052_PYRYE|nr:hypothetical protein I4F81_006062 [Neopyropia yezoensis]
MWRWPGGVAGGGVGIGRDDALLSAWAWLLASDLHMGATPADAPCCAAAAPDAGAVRQSLGCMAAAAAAASSTAAAADAHAAAARALTADALAVTLALYEEAKLTRAAEPDLPVLGSLAAALAARLGADAGAAAATAAAGYRDAAVLAAAIAARLGLDRLGRLRAATAAPVRDVQARCRQRRGWAARGGGGGGGCPAGGVC